MFKIRIGVYIKAALSVLTMALIGLTEWSNKRDKCYDGTPDSN